MKYDPHKSESEILSSPVLLWLDLAEMQDVQGYLAGRMGQSTDGWTGQVQQLRDGALPPCVGCSPDRDETEEQRSNFVDFRLKTTRLNYYNLYTK